MRWIGWSLAGASVAAASVFTARRALLARLLGLRPAEHRVTVTRDVPIRMPDGVVLYADHYAPQTGGPYPTILIRTPYGRPGELGPLGVFEHTGCLLFAERGYNVIVQSVRGRYRSGGVFEPFVNEAADGRATVAWIAEQPWFEGNLGLWGPSYVGYVQWGPAIDGPPYLKAIVPVVTSARFSSLFYPGGAFAFESTLRWVFLIDATNRHRQSLNPAALWRLMVLRERILARALHHQPYADADRIATGASVPFFQSWLNETDPHGSYWSQVDQHRALHRINAAVHLVAGWYDIFLPGQLADYTALVAAGKRPYLTVLPRAHTDLVLVFEGMREGLWWFDAHLKGHRELLARRPVRIALMGSNEWHEMDFWPPPAVMTRYFLQPAGRLAREIPPTDGVPSVFRYHPADPTPAIGGAVLSAKAGPRDQRPLESRPDVLTFTSAPLANDLDVIGPIRLCLYVCSEHEHFDLVGRLCDVYPDGRSINICDGIVRVRPGVGEVQPDGSRRIEIDLTATAQRFRVGHRLRVQVAGGGSPRWGPHPGDDRPYGQGCGGPVLLHRICHDANHPSAIILPVVDAAVRWAS
ncbi:MAG: X-Pro dipeptidyl-peptidase [Chloroflexus sp.]|uniref:CocE/NonD family hydrolase n=1 Tax=Chloroflexus sp. TaxID=1904827 RepID=UPI0021DC614E|nr:CocE/NonD family hydrolase [Chloroflexus sp.]GIV88473.1 MAG: X-Pro dipeptidyl-peptidase [Chloroflexus sp.]